MQPKSPDFMTLPPMTDIFVASTLGGDRFMMTMSDYNWHKWFLQFAELASTKSKDPSTKVGCVLVGESNEVLSIGFNGFPRGVDENIQSRFERPEKYLWTEHAERNAIYNAARQGIKTQGSTAYLNWCTSPCESCVRALIQAGIKRVIVSDVPFPGKGDGEFYDTKGPAVTMLNEAGIPIIIIPVS